MKDFKWYTEKLYLLKYKDFIVEDSVEEEIKLSDAFIMEAIDHYAEEIFPAGRYREIWNWANVHKPEFDQMIKEAKLKGYVKLNKKEEMIVLTEMGRLILNERYKAILQRWRAER